MQEDGPVPFRRAYQRFGQNIEEQQEVLAGIADVMMWTFAFESSVLRTEKAKRHGECKTAQLCTSLFAERAIANIERCATEVVAGASDGDERRTQLALIRKLLRRDTIDSFALGRELAKRLLDAGKYVI